MLPCILRAMYSCSSVAVILASCVHALRDSTPNGIEVTENACPTHCDQTNIDSDRYQRSLFRLTGEQAKKVSWKLAPGQNYVIRASSDCRHTADLPSSKANLVSWFDPINVSDYSIEVFIWSQDRQPNALGKPRFLALRGLPKGRRLSLQAGIRHFAGWPWTNRTFSSAASSINGGTSCWLAFLNGAPMSTTVDTWCVCVTRRHRRASVPCICPWGFVFFQKRSCDSWKQVQPRCHCTQCVARCSSMFWGIELCFTRPCASNLHHASCNGGIVLREFGLGHHISVNCNQFPGGLEVPPCGLQSNTCSFFSFEGDCCPRTKIKTCWSADNRCYHAVWASCSRRQPGWDEHAEHCQACHFRHGQLGRTLFRPHQVHQSWGRDKPGATLRCRCKAPTLWPLRSTVMLPFWIGNPWCQRAELETTPWCWQGPWSPHLPEKLNLTPTCPTSSSSVTLFGAVASFFSCTGSRAAYMFLPSFVLTMVLLTTCGAYLATSYLCSRGQIWKFATSWKWGILRFWTMAGSVYFAPGCQFPWDHNGCWDTHFWTKIFTFVFSWCRFCSVSVGFLVGFSDFW